MGGPPGVSARRERSSRALAARAGSRRGAAVSRVSRAPMAAVARKGGSDAEKQ